MGKRPRKEDDSESTRKKLNSSRIARACDRCQHRKLACDATEHSCQQCQKAKTWCTMTDNLSGIPAYRGQYEYLERRVEKQHQAIQGLVRRLRSLGQNVPNPDTQDNETVRYTAWKQVRCTDPERPWEREDQQANYTRDLVVRDKTRSDLTSRRSSVRAETIPSPELTPFGVLDFIGEPSRQHQASRTYSIPSQLSPTTPFAPIQQSGYDMHDSIPYSQPITTTYEVDRIIPSTIQEKYTEADLDHGAEVDEATTKGRSLLLGDELMGRIMFDDSSNAGWYPYTSGTAELQHYASGPSMMSQTSDSYALSTAAEDRRGVPVGHEATVWQPGK